MIFNKYLFQRITGLVIIAISPLWFKPIYALSVKYLGIVNASLIGLVELPGIIILAIIGLTMFDRSFIYVPERPKGVSLVGMVAIILSPVFANIFTELKWHEQILFWNYDFVGLWALSIIFFTSMLYLFTGIGLLRLNLLAWRVAVFAIMFNILNFYAWTYQYVVSGGFAKHLEEGKAFFAKIGKPDIELQSDIQFLILLTVAHLLLLAYLFKVRPVFENGRD